MAETPSFYRCWQFSADQAIVKRGRLTIATLVKRGDRWHDAERNLDFGSFPEAEAHYAKAKVMPA